MDQKGTNWTEQEKTIVMTQLERILTSKIFAQSPRQGRFLSYIVEATLKEESNRLNQFAVGVEVFDRDESFDPTNDAIVRVEAKRLRSKLTEYYAGPGKNDQVVISMPKGGYGVIVSSIVDEPTPPNSRSPHRRQNILIAAFSVVVLIGSIYIGFIMEPRNYRESPDREINFSQPAIAVLPFENMSSDPNQAYFSDGITEDIITDLSILSGLTVIARHSTFVYKNQNVSISQVAKDLNVQYVLEGSVRKEANRLRITAQLIDTSTEGHVWAQRYDRDLSDVFVIQDEVTGEIVDALEVKLNQAERDRLGYRGTASIDAHDFLLKGQEQFYRFTPESVNTAISLFEKSSDADPNYADAFAWRSEALVYAWISGLDNENAKTIMPAIANARRATEINESLPMAHANYGWALHWNGESQRGIDALSHAIELDPNYANAYLWKSLILSSLGRGQEALHAIENAFRLNPNYGAPHIFALGRANMALGDYDAAITNFERGLDRNPYFLPNHVFTVLVHEITGKRDAAEDASKELFRVHPNYKKSASYQVYLKEHAALKNAPEPLI